MQYIHTMFDNSLKREYKLYQVNAKELSERLKKDYNLPPVMVQLFNSEAELGRYIKDIKSLRGLGHDISSDDFRVQQVRESVAKIKNNDHVKPMTRKGIEFGYELMPIAISVTGDFENPETKLELVDGFKRMFVMDRVPDIEVLVKVYQGLDDREWINAMIVYNSWKFTDSEGAGKYMDRGFQLGLYHRYKILFVNMVLPSWDMFRLLNVYTTGRDLESYWNGGGSASGTYRTFWDNNVFYDDIQAVYDILISQPVFEVKKKGTMETFDTKKSRQNGGLNRILEVFVSLLGEVRRYELDNGIVERKPFDRKILTDYLADPAMQKQFVKVIGMSVDGFIINHIQAHMREDMKKRLFEGMGYTYEPIVKKTPPPHKPFSISEIHL
jgi:hypothetical protein